MTSWNANWEHNLESVRDTPLRPAVYGEIRRILSWSSSFPIADVGGSCAAADQVVTWFSGEMQTFISIPNAVCVWGHETVSWAFFRFSFHWLCVPGSSSDSLVLLQTQQFILLGVFSMRGFCFCVKIRVSPDHFLLYMFWAFLLWVCS